MSQSSENRRNSTDRRSYPPKPYDGPERRTTVVDRRIHEDEAESQRIQEAAAGEKQTGLEQNRGPGKRLQDHTRAADKGEMTDEQFIFLKAIEAFKRVNQKSFPSWTDVLEVVRKLGYRKTMSMELKLPNVNDWTEAADAPSFPDPSEESTETEEESTKSEE